MNKDFDATYLASTLISLQGEIQDLEKWSVFNGDKYNEEIYQLKVALEKIVVQVNQK